jgi:hypothetical protein
MRDIAVSTVIFGTLPFIPWRPHIGVLAWTWIGCIVTQAVRAKPHLTPGDWTASGSQRRGAREGWSSGRVWSRGFTTPENAHFDEAGKTLRWPTKEAVA